jgi:hypothetical protein
MSNVPRAEREERIVRDAGAPDDVVLVVRKSGADRYHDAIDCRHIRKSSGALGEMTRREAQDTTRRAPCLSCCDV